MTNYPSLLGKFWLLSAVLAAACVGQTMRPDPIDKETLLKGIRAGLPTDELVGYVERRGADFLLSPKVRKMFVDGGAHPRLLAAIEASAKQQVGVAACPPAELRQCPEPVACPAVQPCPQAPQPPPFVAKEGSPISRIDTVLLIDAGVPFDRIEALVKKRGVSYALTSDSVRDLKAAGASDALVVTILAAYKEEQPAPQAVASGPLDVIWGTQMLKATRKLPPVFPPAATRMGAKGLVVVTLLIGVDGKVKSATPRQGHEILSGAVLNVIKRWEFQPTLVNAAPVEVRTDAAFTFK